MYILRAPRQMLYTLLLCIGTLVLVACESPDTPLSVVTPERKNLTDPQPSSLLQGELHKEKVRLLDGDTFSYDFDHNGTIEVPRELVRVIGVDAPEQKGRYISESQEPYAQMAIDYGQELIDTATRISIRCLPTRDKYGRNLCHLYLDQKTLAYLLIEKGLGYETVSRYGFQGFDAEGQAIYDISQKVTPAFGHPREWRKKHRTANSGFEG